MMAEDGFVSLEFIRWGILSVWIGSVTAIVLCLFGPEPTFKE